MFCDWHPQRVLGMDDNEEVGDPGAKMFLKLH